MLLFCWGWRFRKVLNIFWLPKEYCNYFSVYYYHCNSGLQWATCVAEISGIFDFKKSRFLTSLRMHITCHVMPKISKRIKKDRIISIIFSRYNFQNTIWFSNDSFSLIPEKLFGFQGHQPMRFTLHWNKKLHWVTLKKALE